MKKITEKEFKQNIDTFLEQATEESIQIEMNNNTLYLSSIDSLQVIDNEWVKEFMAIPEEFRVNPFEISDSGDLYWADRRNVDGVKARIAKK
ncbi:hypothetical protein H1R17_10630 [Flavobacterium sp. xlx-214]|uniref:hypothetical protein n=1 Tax=unclassified Flavobacterium TaxID=196869 RepID=UPI0013D21BED|nr:MULTISPECIES: hypothetical protein [unclassified Flavobacterium]MBA5791671.1 hypothetical protein [Flavobacterium sp. xlx-221]QMI82914.1 hypothetical protein H1R17_10630 [Flavobacterium sp. xlx-214]